MNPILCDAILQSATQMLRASTQMNITFQYLQRSYLVEDQRSSF